MRPAAFAVVLAVSVLPACAQHQHGHSAYAGQQSRDIKALSDDEVKALASGAGMGFAKAAELNRYPGPMHALENADALGLTVAQRSSLESLLLQHKAVARRRGERVIALERELDALFAAGAATPESVDRVTAALGEETARLRAEHLKTHIATTALLSPDQVSKYVRVRGYDSQGRGP